MTTEEIRKAFLQFFAQQGHTIVQSSSLVPAGDPTLLFTNAGMVQFKDCFLGTDKRAYVRATTCQKCLRISGKHNDLENVGRTARHHTFFEMLGNFSFGDYFKKDAILFAWGFLTGVLGLPKDRLWVTIFEEDDEAFALWRENTDVLEGRILRCGKDDNFWAMGETGPCGPCSEIHYYLGDNVTSQSEDEFRKGDGTYIEIWNLVFMQFNRDVSGSLAPLPKPSVDTGMGLERVAAVKQGVLSNYDNDLLRGLIAFTEELSGKPYLGKDYTLRDTSQDRQYAYDVAHRVIADHVRASAFMIADGISASSDGRGYVLRRLIRRACRHGRVLGLEKPFLFEVASKVIALMSSTYPELKTNEAKIAKIIRAEEEKFLATLGSGLAILEKEVSELRQKSSRSFPGPIAFVLHDTYGFPLDLTQDLARSYGLVVDEKGFSEEMEKQKERSRAARAGEAELVLRKMVKPFPSRFVGYDFSEYESSIAGLFGQTGDLSVAREGEEVAIITNETPFYAESGGQIGDTGVITSNDATIEVMDVQKIGEGSIVHICRVVEGAIEPGKRVRLAVDAARRDKLRVNHSATHLLHLALREVLGDHVKQAGSRVSDNSLRFDFSHFEGLTSTQLEEIEAIVNSQVRSNFDVVTQLLPVEEAKKSGAMALFGEKYGDVVRVVQIGPQSRELCGGTHVKRSGDIGLFTVSAENAVAAGVRRIEALAGEGALNNISSKKSILKAISSLMRSGEGDLEDKIRRLMDRNKLLEKEVSRAEEVSRVAHGADLTAQAKVTPSGVRVITSVVERGNPKVLREMADDLKVRLGSGAIALGSIVEGKAILLTAVTEDLTSRFHAGKLMEQIAKTVGSKGGGRPDLAQAGGGDPARLQNALEQFRELFG